MIRIIVSEQNCEAAAGGVENARAERSWRTFDIEAPELEKYLREESQFTKREVSGAEILDQSSKRGS